MMMNKYLSTISEHFRFWEIAQRVSILSVLLFSSFLSTANAERLPAVQETNQQITKIGGVIKDVRDEPLIGVIVNVKGTNTSTLSDAEGRFEITASPNATLMFSYVGFVKQEINVKGQKELIVVLQENSTLDEVVVVGYTRQNRRDVSAAVAKIDMKSLEANPSASLTTMLAGQAPGLQSIIRNGVPGGAGGGLAIRGNTSLASENGVAGISNPLYIVDGVPMSLADIAGYDVSDTDFLSTLNPNDIQAIDILKDAAATAIYGSRGANGVIIITTKRGTSGKARFSGSITMGIVSKPPKMPLYIGEAERQGKLDLIKQTLSNLFGEQAWVDVRNGREVMGYLLPSVLTDKYNPAFNEAYDFQDMFYKSGFTQNYDFSVDGGGEKNSYRIGVGHYDESGVLVGYGFSRTSLSTSLVNDFSKHVHNDFLINYSFIDRRGGLNNLMTAMPSSPTNLPSSLFYRTPEELDRMSGQLGDAYTKNQVHNLTISETLRLNLTDNISWDTQGSAALAFGANKYFIPSTATQSLLSYALARSNTRAGLNMNSVANYHKDFNKVHNVIVMLGTEINAENQQSIKIEAEDGPSDYLKVINGYKKESIDGYTDDIQTNMLSFFGSVSYGYKENRYKVESVLRRDASSRFGANNKWATFPSIKFHWSFSKEPWMAKCSSWLDFGKLRVSYGESGLLANDPLLQYNSLITTSQIGANLYDAPSNKMDVKTYGGKGAMILDFNKISNKSLSWSKAKELNYGLDLEMFNRRILFNADIYSKYISGMVYRSYLPPYLGYNFIESNLVDMLNNGFEMGITGFLFPRDNDFQWEWTLNLAKNKSTIAKLGDGGRDVIGYDRISGKPYAFVVGRPAFQYYMYEYTGTLNNVDDLPVNPLTGEALKYYGADAGLALGLQGKIFPGMPLFTDVNGDYMIDGGNYGNDLKIIDNKSPEPKITGGLQTKISYKGLSLRLQSSFAFGHYIFNTTLQQMLTKFDNIDQFYSGALYKFDESKFWKNPNDGSYYPMIYVSYSEGGSVRAFRESSMFLERGDYWSLDNITLSYNIPKNILNQMQVRGLNVYGTVRNAYMWKKSGVSDPRLITKGGYYNGEGYPLSPTYIVGLQFQF